jgi:transposase
MGGPGYFFTFQHYFSMAKQISSLAAVKYCVGVDISKSEMAVCFSQMDSQQRITVKGSRKFGNNSRGWKALESWVARFRKQLDTPLFIVVEATGVYYEGFAYHFKEQDFALHVVLPNKAKHYAKSLNIKTKTDEVDARVLAQMGLERNLSLWKGMNPTMRKIKQLCRQRETLKNFRSAVSNQLHAHSHSAQAQKNIAQGMQQHLRFLDKQIANIEAELKKNCSQDTELQQRVDMVCTIKGVSLITALCVISEVNGFDLIENKAQLVSYAGYDVVEKQSGTTLRGKTRISKKGNSHIRRALHFPALVAARHDHKLRELYERIHRKNPKTKMIGAVAVQRKLLVLIYTIYKKNQPYDPNFEPQKPPKQENRQGRSLAYTA